MRHRSPRILAPVVSLLVGLAFLPDARADNRVQIKWGEPVKCMKDPKGSPVRVQCDSSNKELRCLVAPNEDVYGTELHRVQDCTLDEDPDAYSKLVKAGARMVPAVAEVPPGFARSEKGRAFQVKFDLLNRVYMGVSWVPTFTRADGKVALPTNFPFGRAQAETGLEISVLSPKGRSRHDIRILEGTATFSDLELTGTLFAYDYQHEHRRPAFYLSSFFGEPRLHEVTPALGWGFRVINVNDRPPSFRNTFDTEFSEAHLSWNPWQSNDMYSHLRIEAGANFGKYWEDRGQVSKGLGTGRWYSGFTSAVKSRFSLGEGGLHYIFVNMNYLHPTLLGGPTAAVAVNRLNASLAYEGIFVAINDQPLSFRVAAMASARDDPGTSIRNVELRFMAGLRFSFWAPPRVFEPLPEIEDP